MTITKSVKLTKMLINIKNLNHLDKGNFFLLAGPCVVESKEICFQIAEKIKSICNKLEIPYIFKSSYKKANRSRIDSFTGIGDKKALDILSGIRDQLNIPVITDMQAD